MQNKRGAALPLRVASSTKNRSNKPPVRRKKQPSVANSSELTSALKLSARRRQPSAADLHKLVSALKFSLCGLQRLGTMRITKPSHIVSEFPRYLDSEEIDRRVIQLGELLDKLGELADDQPCTEFVKEVKAIQEEVGCVRRRLSNDLGIEQVHVALFGTAPAERREKSKKCSMALSTLPVTRLRNAIARHKTVRKGDNSWLSLCMMLGTATVLSKKEAMEQAGCLNDVIQHDTSPDFLEECLQFGLDPNAPDGEGRYPLEYASLGVKRECREAIAKQRLRNVEILVRYGALPRQAVASVSNTVVPLASLWLRFMFPRNLSESCLLSILEELAGRLPEAQLEKLHSYAGGLIASRYRSDERLASMPRERNHSEAEEAKSNDLLDAEGVHAITSKK